MKQSLQLRLGQQITMTPQLQQAIRLLQLSTLELQTEIQQTLDSNMMLEIGEEGAEEELSGENLYDTESAHRDQGQDEEPAHNTASGEVNLEQVSTMPDELPTDSQWDDTYDNSLSHGDYPAHHSGNGDNENRDFTEYNSPTETLQDMLHWQLDLTRFSDTDRAIATLIIDSIDEEGYLQASLEEIRDSLRVADVELDEIKAVLQRVQHFDPPGVGARNLQECLLLQLQQVVPADTPWRELAIQLVSKYLDVLGERDYTQVMRRMKISREDLQAVINLIQSLNPRPGNPITPSKATYVVPDVFVKKLNGQWQVELNPDVAPRLRVNAHYVNLISQVQSRADADSLKTHLQEARWFIKSLKSRHETLLKVTRCIVERQSGFLDYGEEAMKPLVLYDIAEELGMHESTISRVTTQKYIHTPRGIYELKYFFSSHVSTDAGGECSSTAIRAFIRKLIAAENTGKPLSDNRIAKLLSEQGIQVARRTVAKYREAMLIPPSNERKCLV